MDEKEKTKTQIVLNDEVLDRTVVIDVSDEDK